LLFEVAGLTLAVPLVKLKGVVSGAAELTPMPGHSPLFLGVVPYQGLQSKVVDTARFVLPADRAARLSDDAAGRSHHLVMIDEGRWALAASSIGDVVELDRSDVKWRSAAGKRVWLAGTVIEQMCALLDIDRLIGELASGMG
jgi:purine-binding chemotaxis protein CheW